MGVASTTGHVLRMCKFMKTDTVNLNNDQPNLAGAVQIICQQQRPSLLHFDKYNITVGSAGQYTGSFNMPLLIFHTLPYHRIVDTKAVAVLYAVSFQGKPTGSPDLPPSSLFTDCILFPPPRLVPAHSSSNAPRNLYNTVRCYGSAIDCSAECMQRGPLLTVCTFLTNSVITKEFHIYYC